MSVGTSIEKVEPLYILSTKENDTAPLEDSLGEFPKMVNRVTPVSTPKSIPRRSENRQASTKKDAHECS